MTSQRFALLTNSTRWKFRYLRPGGCYNTEEIQSFEFEVIEDKSICLKRRME